MGARRRCYLGMVPAQAAVLTHPSSHAACITIALMPGCGFSWSTRQRWASRAGRSPCSADSRGCPRPWQHAWRLRWRISRPRRQTYSEATGRSKGLMLPCACSWRQAARYATSRASAVLGVP